MIVEFSDLFVINYYRLNFKLNKPSMFVIVSMGNGILTDIIDFVFPKRCVHCGAYLQTYLCNTCRGNLHQIEPESFVTRRHSKDWVISKNYITPFEKVWYFYEYNEVIHSIIDVYKFYGNKEIGKVIAELMKEQMGVNKISENHFDVITFVPSHRSKINIRGFDHILDLANNMFDKDKVISLLIKNKSTKPQSELKREKRLKNLSNVFSLKANVEMNGFDKILIIDDICTTGTTFNECAKTIKSKFPNAKIFGLALARGKI